MTTAPTSTKPQPPPPGQRPGGGGPRRYIYCIIDCDTPKSFDSPGIGDDTPEVFAIPCQGVAAVVSPVASDEFDISRANLLTHQRLLETVMRAGHTVLPVRFNTIAKDRGGKSAERIIIDRVLAARKDEFANLLTFMNRHVEMGVKGLWPDINAVFQRIVEDDREIALLRGRLLSGPGPGASRPGDVAARMRLGERVKTALEARKEGARKQLISRLSGTVADMRENSVFGDAMFANLALLVEESRLADLEGVLSAFEADQAGGARLRYVGPMPPSSFIELVIDWEE